MNSNMTFQIQVSEEQKTTVDLMFENKFFSKGLVWSRISKGGFEW